MSHETKCVVHGVDMDVHFDYSAACGGGYHEPDTPAEVTINSVMYHELEMDELLSEYDMESITIQILEQKNDMENDYDC